MSRPRIARQPGLSVLLVTIDTLRADAIGAYGNARALTPSLDRLARGGVRFDDAHAHNVVTLPSHANILSGRYPTDHGVRDNAGFRFPSSTDTMATLLKARGYRTGAFVSAFPLASRFGLSRGFDVYEDSFVDAHRRPAFVEQERRGAETVAVARRWIDAQRDAPFFCWVHIYEPHFPYEPPEPYASRFAGDPYHGEVATADAALAPLLDPILASGNRGNVLVAVTADHGESLGEHGEATHGIFAYEATLRVPLVLYQPRLFQPRVVTEGARHVDLLPTILDALSVPVPAGLAGRSLLALAQGARRGPAAATTSYFEALAGPLNRGWAPLYGVVHEGTKYVELPLPEFYDLRADPRETRNRAADEPQLLAAMRALLSPLRAADRDRAPVAESAETRERLRSLGYAGGAAQPKTRYTDDDDPKRLIGLDTTLQDVATSYRGGDIANALRRCRDLVRRRPDMPLSLLYLAQLERESGDLSAGAAALEKALALNPADPTTAALLGSYLTLAGRAREAADLLEPFASREDPDVEVLTTRGLALGKVGRMAEARAVLAKARAVEPNNAMVLVDVGAVELMAHETGAARAAFESALALNPALARAHGSLGLMAAQAGRLDEAVDRWTKAIALDAHEVDQPLAMATLLWKQGRRTEARTCLKLFVATAPRSLYEREIERARSLLSGGELR